MKWFDERIERLNTSSVKWERTKEVFGTDDVLPMWVADMDFRPPQEVTEALKERIDHGIFGYTFIPPSTYEAITEWQKKRNGWDVHSSWVLFCSGVVPAIGVAIQSFTEPGDKVLLQSPVYTPFFEMVKVNGREVVNSPLVLKEGRYEIDFTSFEQALKQGCKLFLLCNPHNPGGRSWTKEELLQIGELCKKYDCLIVSDEIHSDLVYKNRKHIPIAFLNEDLANRTITCIAPSKTFNLAGLQASALIIKNENLRDKFNHILKQQGFFTLNLFGIVGMETAYRYGESWLNQLLDYLQGNKELVQNYLAENLPQIKYMDPDGTYLLWLDCRNLGLGDKEIRKQLLEKGKLALEPGTKYGPGGEGFVRMNIACPRETLNDGLERLKRAFT